MPTALELSRKGWKHYVEAASRRLEPVAVRPEVEETRKQLLTRVHKLTFDSNRHIFASVTQQMP
jgi:hypothetical protein